MSSQPLATAVVQALGQHITDVFLCPGSRNCALSLAMIAHPSIRVHVRLDERSAAFAALGMARVQGHHVAVVTTSGTAVANCLPAMLEAMYASLPLVVVSADRPRRFVGTGASQTIEQRNLLSVMTIDVESEADIPEMTKEFVRGQVHVNVRLEEPLVAELPTLEPSPAPGVWEYFGDFGELQLDLSKRTLVVAGDETWRIPALEDVPTIAEPSAPAPYRPVHPLAAGVFAHQQVSAEGFVVDTKPEQIVVVGHPTLHRAVQALMLDWDIDVHVLNRSAKVTNPWGRTDASTNTRVKAFGEQPAQWLQVCESASVLAAQAVRDALADPELGFTGLHVAAAVADSLATGDTFVVGASNPVRDASLAGLPFDGVDTYSPRGVAGIDGTVSQAIGVALATQAAHPAEPRAPRTVALVGDVTFLHDVGGLLATEHTPLPENLTIVVANDDGCGIFESLEIGAEELRPSFEQAFGTPHGVDLGALCAGYQVPHTAVDNLSDLIVALDDAAEIGGFQVIEAQTTRATRRALDAALKVNLVV